jgi:ribosomal protein S18 acetylase RimI-like enzyme
MLAGPDTATRTARLLSVDDLEQVIAIDLAHSGHTRRHFFAKRMAAAKLHPHDFIQVGVIWGGSLCGFAIARVLRGEFGREHAVAVLDAVGVEPQSQECGVGEALIKELIRILRDMGVRSLQSQVRWANPDLLRFFDASGFALAPRLALERPVAERLDEPSEEE